MWECVFCESMHKTDIIFNWSLVVANKVRFDNYEHMAKHYYCTPQGLTNIMRCLIRLM